MARRRNRHKARGGIELDPVFLIPVALVALVFVTIRADVDQYPVQHPTTTTIPTTTTSIP